MRTRLFGVGIVAVVGGLMLFACVGDAPSSDNGDGGGTDGAGDGGGTPCTTSATCPATAPTCSGGVCGACAPSSSDCAKFASTPVCGPAGACVACVPTSDGGSVSSDCASTPSTPFCGPSDTCVECLTANDCAPHVCGGDNACRACQKNSECPAGACGDDGNCVAASDIAYVDNGGVPAATCAMREPINGSTIASAYCDIPTAIGKKPYIVVIGRGPTWPYTPFNVDIGASAETIIGPAASGAGAAVIGGTLPPIADTVGAGHANVVVNAPAAAPGVTIDGFEITSTSTGVDGIYCHTTTVNSALRVRNSYFHNLNGDAVYDSSCDLTFEDSKTFQTDVRAIEDANNNVIVPKYVIQRNVFLNGNSDGVYVGGGGLAGVDLTFDRNIVANYAGGNGLQIQGNGSYRITNSFFFLNAYALAIGTGGSSPVKLFQFNTVVANSQSGLAGCNDTGLVLESSIIVNNNDTPGCTLSHVVKDGDPAPAFVNSSDPSNYDFHLAVDTPAHTTSNTACCIDKVPASFDAGAPLSNHDYDGTSRPMGGGYDIGAHEAK